MSVAVYRVSEQKCATCRWWQGARGVELRGYQPYYVKVEAGPAPCMALNGHAAHAGNHMPAMGEVGKVVSVISVNKYNHKCLIDQ